KNLAPASLPVRTPWTDTRSSVVERLRDKLPAQSPPPMLGGISAQRRKGRAPTESDRAGDAWPCPFQVDVDLRRLACWAATASRVPTSSTCRWSRPTTAGRRAPGLDWWPTKQIAERQRMLRQEGTAALILWRQYWHTRKGTPHTADLLAAAKDAEEGGAIWLAASLWDFLHPVYEEWRGQP